MEFTQFLSDDADRPLKRLAFLELAAEDIDLIKAEYPRLHHLLPDLEAVFLNHLCQQPELRNKLTDRALARIGNNLSHYFDELICGEYDDHYVAERLRVGTIHQLIGLETRWYLGAYRKYIQVLMEKIFSLYADEQKALALTQSLLKVIFFDIGLAMDAYMAAEKREIFRSREISFRAIEILQSSACDERIDYLTSLTSQICQSLGVRYVMVVRVPGPDFDEGVALTAVDRGVPVSKPVYKLAGTPCFNVFTEGACVYPENVQELFPEDILLMDMGVQAYAGIPLRDRWGQVIGLLVVADDKPIDDPEKVEQILLMVGGRVAAEIMRTETDVQLAKTMDALEYHATRDELTGLPNRVLFYDRLKQAIAEAQRNESSVVLMHVDLDDFKLVNDSLGHAAGDLVLQDTANRLQTCVREGDTVARAGADEFMVILRDVKDLSSARVVAEKLQAAIWQPFVVAGEECHQNASIGIAIWPQDTADEDLLIRFADIAVHRAKEVGRGNYQFFSQDMSERTLQRVQMEKMLRQAVENREFAVYYQPITDLRSQRLVGAEALLRWIHPEQGMIPPDVFIPISESTRLIIPLGHWLVDQVCTDLAHINSISKKQLSFAINISPAQIVDTELLATIKNALARHHINARQIVLEITENLFLYDMEYTFRLMQEFKKIGLRLSLDDFGTGYSSLSYLKKYPFDKVKIDRSFVSDLPDNADDAAIANATISMAHALGLVVIAEGVETQKQADYLHQHQCDFVQGYYYSRPIPVAEFIEKYRNELEVG